jgi:hypothetical protein
MMGSDGWRLDPAMTVALVARVIRDLDHRNEEESDVLLSNLLCAAWPTCWAQHQ